MPQHTQCRYKGLTGLLNSATKVFGQAGATGAAVVAVKTTVLVDVSS